MFDRLVRGVTVHVARTAPVLLEEYDVQRRTNDAKFASRWATPQSLSLTCSLGDVMIKLCTMCEFEYK